MSAASFHDMISSELLPAVQAPAQYIGGEINEIRKDPGAIDTTVALAFPDTYGVGMSHLGLAILYNIVNQMPHVAAERVFCPWTDAAEVMRSRGIDLFSWESRRKVRDFDIVGITLQHELSYSNILYLLDLAGITFRAAERLRDEPLIIGGGPLADCCEPVADFFDAVILGDGEESLPAFIEAYRQLRAGKTARLELLAELARRFDFLYVPQLYHCEYGDDSVLVNCRPTEVGLPTTIERAIVADLDAAEFPTAPIVAHTEAIHDRIAIEIMRGCPQRCAFCHAGHTKGPLRYRKVETILDIARQSQCNTGHDTISLLSLSTSDYPHLAELAKGIYQQFEGQHVGISLPSLRVDKQLRDIPAQLSQVRREGLTIAVETASDRLRKAIGKAVTNVDLFESCMAAYEAGWRKVKLYFMVGFPGESEDDIAGIVDLAAQISQLRRRIDNQPAMVNAAISWLAPKPHTPLAWVAQQSLEYFQTARHLIIDAKRQLRGPSVVFKFHRMENSILEAALSRGDRRLSGVLETAYRNGARFDAWSEHFDYQRYLDAFASHGLDPAFYAQRPRPADEILPWDHLGGGSHDQLYTRLKKIREMLELPA